MNRIRASYWWINELIIGNVVICTGRLNTVDSEVDGTDSWTLVLGHSELTRSQLTPSLSGALGPGSGQQITEVGT